jgi:HTH-type transcriptional regulator / antitoxin HipB
MTVYFGDYIREQRKLAGLTQKELADLAGIGKTTVFDIEKNKQSVRLENIMLILNVLNIELTASGPLGNSVQLGFSTKS